MARLRNLPTNQVSNFASLIDVKDQQVISMSLTDSDHSERRTGLSFVRRGHHYGGSRYSS